MDAKDTDRKNIPVTTSFILLFASAFIISLIMIAACSPKAGNSLVKFFFDGIPEAEKKDTAVVVMDTAIAKREKQTKFLAVKIDSSSIFVHVPYKERACEKCHQGNSPDAIKYSQDAFCYSCHKNYNEMYEIVHGPVAGGFCTNCHTPHQANNKKLLVRKGQDICTGCHDKATILKNETHADIGTTSCTECHNPHGGNDRYFSY